MSNIFKVRKWCQIYSKLEIGVKYIQSYKMASNIFKVRKWCQIYSMLGNGVKYIQS